MVLIWNSEPFKAEALYEARQVRVFFRPKKLLLAALFTLNSSAATFIRKPDNNGPAAKAALLFSDTPCRITTGPDSKAAMNRPQRFRGLATDPGVQRKTSKAVIQRENKPKGPRLEEQFESICTAPVAPKDQRNFSLMHLVTGALGKQPEEHGMTMIIKDTFTSGAQVSMEMDKDEGELFVFHCPAGQGCKVSKWPLDSYHMPIAMAHYAECCGLEKAA